MFTSLSYSRNINTLIIIDKHKPKEYWSKDKRKCWWYSSLKWIYTK